METTFYTSDNYFEDPWNTTNATSPTRQPMIETRTPVGDIISEGITANNVLGIDINTSSSHLY